MGNHQDSIEQINKEYPIEMKKHLQSIKSKYILKKILDNLEKKKFLEIIKYNKNTQKRIDMDINDYKRFSEINSKIEIEVVPISKQYFKIINISKEEEPYYHIYINNNTIEEKNKCYYKGKNKINKIRIIIDHEVKSLSSLFYYSELQSINFIKFHRNDINDMSMMFNGCSSLKELNISKIKTENATNMSFMFENCKSLKKLDLSNLITDNVTDMSCMFSYCISLKEINLNNFKTNNVKNMTNYKYY